MKLIGKQHLWDNLGLIFIGIVSLGYVIFVILFAELHIQIPFLDFPIFVGEMLLFVCLILFLFKYYNYPCYPLLSCLRS